MKFTCSRQTEIKEALGSGHWPQACDADLREHANRCSCCAELVLVTETFRQARGQAAQAARLSSPELLWWRAQLRRRYSAFEQVARPVAVAQGFALTLTLLVAAGFVVSQWQYGARWLSWFSELSRSSSFRLPTLESFPFINSEVGLLLLLPICGALAVFSGVAVYLAAERQ